MPNLYVFDKDATLAANPLKDGYVGHPEDQVLYDGVRDKLDRLRSEGHVLAIVSNQGGCDFTTIPCYCLEPGHQFKLCLPGFGYDLDMLFKVLSTTIKDDLIDIETENATFTTFKKDVNMVKIQHKTIEGAIDEMQFAADLCGITEAYFAPTMDGKSIISLSRSDSKWHHQIETPSPESKYSFGGFRKPQPGMLLMPSYGYKFDRRVMIGDRDSDRKAAIAAGFDFMWAEDWRNAQK